MVRKWTRKRPKATSFGPRTCKSPNTNGPKTRLSRLCSQRQNWTQGNRLCCLNRKNIRTRNGVRLYRIRINRLSLTSNHGREYHYLLQRLKRSVVHIPLFTLRISLIVFSGSLLCNDFRFLYSYICVTLFLKC